MAYRSTETFTPDNLVAGDFPIVTEKATIASAAANDLKRGTILGKITTGGKLTGAKSTSNDGSQTPYAILAEDVDATAEDQKATVYLTGSFNKASLIAVAEGEDADTFKAGLRDISIFVKEVL